MNKKEQKELEKLYLDLKSYDNMINYWQTMAKFDKMKLDIAYETINRLVENKKQIVEKIKYLECNSNLILSTNPHQ